MKNNEMTCPACGTMGEKQIGSRICTSNIDEKTKRSILNGELFSWQCPNCSERFFINSTFLYNDDKKRFMLYLVPGFKDGSYKVPTVIKARSDYDTENSTLRIVPSFSEFVEKIRIFEAGLDDRIVEAIKLLYINMHLQDGGSEVYDMVFENTDENGSLLLGVFLENDDYEQAVPVEIYKNTTEEFASILPEEKHDEFIVVDQEWLRNILSS